MRLAVSILLLSMAACSRAAESSAPNIVVFLADDLGWADVGFHGSEIETPNLDRLAAQGVELTHHYAAPMCSPTRAAFLTGRYPARYGLQVGVIRPWSEAGLDPNETLFPEILRAHGYATHLVGKWHLGAAQTDQLPTRRGFDTHYGQYTGLVDYFTHRRLGGLDWHENEAPSSDEGHATELLCDAAVEIVREHDFSAPLFLFVSFSAPHFPLQPLPEDADHYADKIEDEARRNYAGLVTGMDRAIGATLDALEQRGVSENTLILFFSDNGAYRDQGGSNGELRGQKADLYEGAVRVPSLAVWRGELPRGARLDSPTHVVDWMPTLLGRAGIALPEDRELDGVDLWRALRGESKLPARTLLLNTQRKHGAVRDERFKLVVDFHRRATARVEEADLLGVELFDLLADPFETKNLAEDEPEARERLRAVLADWTSRRRPVPPDRGMQPADFVAPEVYGPRRDH